MDIDRCQAKTCALGLKGSTRSHLKVANTVDSSQLASCRSGTGRPILIGVGMITKHCSEQCRHFITSTKYNYQLHFVFRFHLYFSSFFSFLNFVDPVIKVTPNSRGCPLKWRAYEYFPGEHGRTPAKARRDCVS